MEKELQILEFSKRLKNPEGHYFLKCEQEKINELLPQYHGFFLVQLGAFDNYDLKSASTMMHRVYVDVAESSSATHKNIILSTLHQLPFLFESVDLFFLPHTLEFCSDPHKLLSEIYHILIPGGKLILLGFNPFSLLGLTKLLKSAKNRPWFGKLRSFRRVKYWLSECGFSIEYQQCLCFRPSLRNDKALEKWSFLESLGKTCFPFSGGVYVLVAQKKVIPLSPVKMKAFSKRIPVASGFPEPSTNKSL